VIPKTRNNPVNRRTGWWAECPSTEYREKVVLVRVDAEVAEAFLLYDYGQAAPYWAAGAVSRSSRQ